MEGIIMNRALKKATSFLTALVMCASLMTAGSVTASAASNSVTVKQVVKDNNKMALGFNGGVFFATNFKTTTQTVTSMWGEESQVKCLTAASGAEYTMVTSDGKSVKVKNTINFDKLYRVSTFGTPTYMKLDSNGDNYYEDLAACVVVGKGNKYAGILSNGKFLANGKYFDNIVVGNDYITTTSGKTTVIYNAGGKQLAKWSNKDLGVIIDNDASSKTLLMSKEIEGEFRSYKYNLVNQSGKVLKSFSNVTGASFEKVNGKTYLVTTTRDPETWDYSYTYYTTAGKKTNVKVDDGYSYQIKTFDRDLIVSFEEQPSDDEYNRSYDIVVTDKKGNEIYRQPKVSASTYISSSGKGDGDAYQKFFWTKDKLLIANGDFVVFDEKTGKEELRLTDHNYCSVEGVTENGNTYELAYSEDDDSFGGYGEIKRILVSSKGKTLSKAYSMLDPLSAWVDVYKVTEKSYGGYSYFMWLSDNTSFYAYDEDYNIGMINIKGKEIAPVTYTGIYTADDNITIFRSKNETYDIRNNSTGKTYLSKLRFPSWTDNIWGIYRDVPVYRELSKTANRLVTSNKAGNKFGCVTVVTKK